MFPLRPTTPRFSLLLCSVHYSTYLPIFLTLAKSYNRFFCVIIVVVSLFLDSGESVSGLRLLYLSIAPPWLDKLLTVSPFAAQPLRRSGSRQRGLERRNRSKISLDLSLEKLELSLFDDQVAASVDTSPTAPHG